MTSGVETWSTALAIVACGTALLTLYLPVLSDFISWLKSLRADTDPAVAHGETERLLFVVPAHDEAAVIADCVASLVDMDYPESHRRIVVIADNCVDDTADRARAGGADCLEREDPSQPGKPRAIAWALDQLGGLREWDACVVIDADTVVQPDFARALSASGPLRSVAAQAYFDVLNPDDTWLTRLGKILATVRYEILYPLKSRASLNCPLTGNGMCIGTELLTDRGWRAFSLTENWELFAQYTAEGTRIRFVPGARLVSEEARTMTSGATQRKRWLAGRLTILRQWLPELLASRSIGFHQKLDAIAELSNPGPVLHGLLAVGTTVACLVLIGESLGLAMAIAALAALAPLLLATASSIRRQEDPKAALLAFVGLPVYAVWRLATAVGTVKTWRSGRWEKTKRGQQDS
ncbi:MAG: glycosyltransferase family 2 protein [Gemmatimonadota bacterium]